MKKIKNLISIASLLIVIIVIIGCTKNEKDSTPLTRSVFKLNTMVDITLYDKKEEEIIDKVLELCDYYENIYSRTLETSELYRLNEGLLEAVEGVENSYYISDDLKEIIEYGLYYSNLSKGAFDITVEPVSSLWDFTSTEDIVPEQELVKEQIKYVGYEGVILDGNKLTFKNSGMGLDLGAIAKGFIADKLKESLLDQGVTSGIINLGGNVLLVGNKDNNIPFQIGIQKPFADRNELVSVMSLEDVSVVSSGIYERSFTVDGEFYHHLLDTRTGYPLKNELIGVTIISEQSVDGDGLSTSVFALGLEEGLKLIESIPNTYGVFITEDYTLHYSQGFQNKIKITPVN